MTRFIRLLLMFSLSFFSLFVAGCTARPAKDLSVPFEETKQLLGTIITVKAYGEKAEEAVNAAFARATEIENRMSPKIADSEISQINKAAGQHPVKVSPDTFLVIQKAIAYASLTDGAFDPAIGNIINLWGIGTDHAKVPTKEELQPYINKSLYNDITLNEKTQEVYLTNNTASLDLGAIAKGYAGDEMKRVLLEQGINSALLNLGGNVLTVGTKLNGSNWVIGLQNPLNPSRGNYIGKMSAPNKTIVTSGNYERYFIKDGIRYHHIIDGKTGFPAKNGVISTTIITDDSIDADALSTSVYVLGKDKGLALIESLKNVEAIFITEDKHIFATSGITDKLFTLTSEEYTYEKR